MATGYVAIAEDAIGQTRAELLEAIADIPVGARERKLADGLRKLVLDRCEFESDAALSPVTLRDEVFTAAAEARRQGAFDREALIAEAATRHGVEAAEIERLLYADLRDAQRLLRFDGIAGDALVDRYDEAQVQAVLLRAETVVATVQCRSASSYRYLFRKLKFHRLLHEIEADGDGYRITMSGPLSLFRSGTKYGLSLALVLPAIRACDRWAIDAIVRWGKDRAKLSFRAEGKATAHDEETALPKEVQVLFDKQTERVEKGKGKWRPEQCTEILSVPGLGVCAPDLVFERNGQRVYMEVLGFWSRDAVWKRVELAEAGLPVPIVFAVLERLRVSEEVLPKDIPAALYVYKGVMSPVQIEKRLEQVASSSLS